MTISWSTNWLYSTLQYELHLIMRNDCQLSYKSRTPLHTYLHPQMHKPYSHIQLLTHMVKYTHELTYADTNSIEELSSKRQEILKVSKISHSFSSSFCLRIVYVCRHYLYSALLFEFIVSIGVQIKYESFAFLMLLIGNMFKHPVRSSYIFRTHKQSLGNLLYVAHDVPGITNKDRTFLTKDRMTKKYSLCHWMWCLFCKSLICAIMFTDCIFCHNMVCRREEIRVRRKVLRNVACQLWTLTHSSNKTQSLCSNICLFPCYMVGQKQYVSWVICPNS